MTTDPLVLIPEIDRATARLVETARKLDEAAVAAPSLLPGWSRGNVLTHVARNADGLVNLLTWARTGVETPQYVSMEQRDADIQAGARRSPADLVADLVAAAERVDAAVERMSPESWTVVVRWTSGNSAPVAWGMWSRLREVEVHHVDLDAGYAPADWPDAFVHRLLHELAGNFTELADAVPVRLHATDLGHEIMIKADPAAPTVTGPGHAIAAWLTGRSTGAGLTSTAGELPAVPTWK